MTNKFLSGLILFVIVGIILIACNKGDKSGKNKILATVFNRNLYLSDLKNMIPEGATAEDSSLIINAFVERWVRDVALEHEAKLAVPKDLNIDKLVADYRSSLAKNNYEKTLIQEYLDSVVTEQDYLAYYEKNKNQFLLKAPLYKCYYLKIPEKTAESGKLKKWLQKSEIKNIQEIKDFAANYATNYLLNDSVWYQAEQLLNNFPEGAIEQRQLQSKKLITHSDGNFKYFLKVTDKIAANEVSPLEMVRNQIKTIILHQRKKKLLREKKEALYERALRGNNIKINK